MKSSHASLFFLCIAIIALLAACATPTSAPTPAPVAASTSAQVRTGDRDLAQARREYEDGDYKNAVRLFQSALGARLQPSDRAVAHKHLAFIFCAQSQFEPCRAQFRSAFDANPQFELTPSESGHPLWGPVYREIAADVAKRRARK
jgi:Tfp pilus assembly protein PilF